MATKNHSTDHEGIRADAGLTPQQIRHLPKPRSGFTELVAPLVALYEENASRLGAPPLSPAELAALASEYQQKLQVERQLERQLRVASEERLQCGSSLWSAILSLYAVARATARTDRTIRSAVGQLESFFKKVHKRKATTPQP